MKPETIGRALGVGLRVAGRMAGQRMAASAQAGASQPMPQTAQTTMQPRSAGQSPSGLSPVGQNSAGPATARTKGSLTRGVTGFLRPFRRVGGILWLEVTGVFFLLFALVFGTAMWKIRPASVHGPYGKPFLTAAAMLVVFLYLGVTSFLSARHK
jgi:hypothetical protein